MPGRWDGSAVAVLEQAEANRLYNRGRFGRPLSGGSLRLDPVEAAFLAETGRLALRDAKGAPVKLAQLIEEAARAAPGFDTEFLVYRDLRGRGYQLTVAEPGDRRKGVHFLSYGRGEAPAGAQPDVLVSARSEREPVRLSDLAAWADTVRRRKARNLVGVVDEESDLTYYEVGFAEPSGDRPPTTKAEAAGVFLRDRVLVWNPDAVARLHDGAFFGKPVAGGLQLSLVESLHLVLRGGLQVQDSARRRDFSPSGLRKEAEKVDPKVGPRLAVYNDLRARGLAVKTGFKFGTHFRAYSGDPKEHHAPFLVHVVAPEDDLGWPPIARAVRLSHSVRKEFLFALPASRGVRYVRITRQRP